MSPYRHKTTWVWNTWHSVWACRFCPWWAPWRLLLSVPASHTHLYRYYSKWWFFPWTEAVSTTRFGVTFKSKLGGNYLQSTDIKFHPLSVLSTLQQSCVYALYVWDHLRFYQSKCPLDFKLYQLHLCVVCSLMKETILSPLYQVHFTVNSFFS